MKSKLFFAVGLVISLSAQADVSLHPLVSGERDALWISGQISPNDPAALKKHLQRHHIVLLDSPGGDVHAAIELGRILRRMSNTAVVYPEKVCASACVFVLAGAVDKMIYGKVGIHRPYQPNDKIVSPDQQKRFYLQIENEVKEYLDDMNVNPSLWDDMIRISPANIKILKDDELERYGLSGTDPYIEEARRTDEANSLRISKQELLMRRARMENECNKYIKKGLRAPNVEYGICATSIHYGISMAEYKRRAAKAVRECGLKGTIEYARCFDTITRGF